MRFIFLNSVDWTWLVSLLVHEREEVHVFFREKEGHRNGHAQFGEVGAIEQPAQLLEVEQLILDRNVSALAQVDVHIFSIQQVFLGDLSLSPLRFSTTETRIGCSSPTEKYTVGRSFALSVPGLSVSLAMAYRRFFSETEMIDCSLNSVAKISYCVEASGLFFSSLIWIGLELLGDYFAWD